MTDFDPAQVLERIRPAVVDLGKRIVLVAATGPGLQRLRDRCAKQPWIFGIGTLRLDRNRGAGPGPVAVDRTRGAGEP